MKCKFCVREFPVSNYKSRGACQGAVNFHQRSCEIKHLRAKSQEGQVTKTGVEPKCTHEFRFLNTNDQAENLAIQNGYSEVCVKCEGIQ